MVQKIINILERFKDVAHYILLDDANKNLENKEERLNNAIEQTINNKIACLKSDLYLDNIIKTDTWDITNGRCNNFDGTVGWFCVDDSLRIYALGNEGGIALIYYKSKQPLAGVDNRYASLHIHTLGKDDGIYCIDSSSCYTACNGSVKEFSIIMKAVLDKFIELTNL